MQLTKSSEYAMRAMAHLAATPNGEFVHIVDISRVWDVPEHMLRRIIPKLVRAGFISTVRGRDGGIRLNRAPSNISVLEIIESVEGPIQINECMKTSSCERNGFCIIQPLWREAQNALTAVLKNRKLSEIKI